MKVLPINLIKDKYLTVLTFRVTFFEGLIFIKNVFGPRVNLFNDTFATTNLFRKQLLLASTAIWEIAKRGLTIKRLDFRINTLLEYTTQPAKQNIITKNGNDAQDFLGDSQKRYRALRQR